MIDLTIVIPVLNNANFTKSALLDLCQLPSNHQIIVIDNGSTDETKDVVCEIIDSTDAFVLYKKFDSNKGFSAANNEGYRMAGGRNVLFLNNDIRVKQDLTTWTEQVIKECDAGFMVAVNGCLLNSNFDYVKDCKNLVDSPYYYLGGWFLGGSKDTFDKLLVDTHREEKEMKSGGWGPWNEMFYPAYFEDVDLSWRAREKGIPFKLVDVPVHHFGKMTGKKMNLPSLYRQSQKTFKDLWHSSFQK